MQTSRQWVYEVSNVALLMCASQCVMHESLEMPLQVSVYISHDRVVHYPKFTIAGIQMDIRKVKKLIELLEDSDVAEIEIKEGEESVRISRISAAPRRLPWPHHRWFQRPHFQHPPTNLPRRPRRTYHRAIFRSHQWSGLFIAPGPGSASVCRSWAKRFAWRPSMHHRGDENHESDRG